jgi:nitrogen fixation protein FixH
MSRAIDRSSASWIPWTILGGLGAVMMANAALVYFALASAPGTVSERPFEEGNAYNGVLAQDAAQASLGWTAQASLAGLVPDAAGGRRGEIVLVLKDRTGAALRQAEVTLTLQRAVGPVEVLRSVPSEAEGGRYVALLDLPHPGLWIVEIQARRGADRFFTSQRLLAP